MTNKYAGNGLWTGLSSDTKPVSPSGFRFLETDTGDLSLFDGTYWWLQQAGSFSNKRYGSFFSSISATSGNGILNVLTNATGAGSQAFAYDNTNGRYLNCISGTTVGNKGGQRTSTHITQRQFSPRISIRFKLATSSLARLYFGFIGGSPTEPTGDDPYGAGASGVTFGFKSGDTNFGILHNDPTGATVTEDTGTTIDTASAHRVNMVADAGNNRFSWNYDGGAYGHITDDIPTATNVIGVCWIIETNESGVAKSFQLHNVFLQADS